MVKITVQITVKITVQITVKIMVKILVKTSIKITIIMNMGVPEIAFFVVGGGAKKLFVGVPTFFFVGGPQLNFCWRGLRFI